MTDILTEVSSGAVRGTLLCLGFSPDTVENASAFERFAMLCSHLDLLTDNECAESLVRQISGALEKKLTPSEVARMSPAWLWNACVNGKICVEKQNDNAWRSPQIECDEKDNNREAYTDLSSLVADLPSGGGQRLDNIVNSLVKSGNDRFFVRYGSGELVRPNAYAMQREIDAACRGKKYNSNLLQTGLIFEYFYAKKCRKIQLCVDARENIEYACELVKYLCMRSLSARIFLVCTNKLEPRELLKLCTDSAAHCHITPIISQRDDAYIAELSGIYPRGLIKSSLPWGIEE